MMKATLLPLALATALSIGACSKQPAGPAAGAVASALGTALPTKLCDVIRKVTPEVRQMPPVGAQAQLVMAIAAAFDNNATALAQVSDQIDTIAIGSCSAERDILLSVLKRKSLQEAVR